MEIKTRLELIKAYIDFFKSKKHKHIPSSSLIPENDPTVLFTTAGMHPLVPYLLGQKHPLGKRLVNVQKCIRTNDIDEVGNETHHTFFEMLGNWSLGDAEVRATSDTQKSRGHSGYWKKEAIEWSFEFLTKVLGFEKEKLAISCFAGDEYAPRDRESFEIWRSLGIPEKRIAFLGKEDNWWGPMGDTGPCGPDTEMFYWVGEGRAPEEFNPNDSTLATDGKDWVEIGNNVLLQYNKTKGGKYEELEQKNVDFGGGVERTLAVLNGLDDNYKTSVFEPIIREIEKISGKKYEDSGVVDVRGERIEVIEKENKRQMRIIADHVKAATFILGDERGIKPSNLGQGYVLRRLIRRAIRYGRLLGIEGGFLVHVAKPILEIYPDYQELHKNHKFIFEELELEEKKFGKTLEKGLRKFKEVISDGVITGREAFLLFQSYGFPIEMTEELADERGVKVDLEEYNEEFRKHQDLSRTASAGQFKSGLADDSEQTKKLHTATHLLNEALRRVLGESVKQKGSNINPERLRFDFSFSRKLTNEEIRKVEEMVNEKVEGGLEVEREEVPLKDALQSGAQAEFGGKYPDVVSVYTIVSPSKKKSWFSREICTGPHVKNTKEIGKFKIIKEEGVAAGVRRIKAVVENE